MAAQVLQSNTIQAQGNVNINNTTNYNQILDSRQETMDILCHHVAFGALHDSAERFDPPKCHQNTRTAVLARIDRWAWDTSENAKPILWLNGAAGAGKSAIAQTLVEKWKREKLAVPTFFFSRTSSERNCKTCFVPTITFQLSKLVPITQGYIEDIIWAGSIFKRNLKAQMIELVVQPLMNIPAPGNPIVFVIDGLDECSADLPCQDREAQQREILEAVNFACQWSPSLRFLITSRPERQIRESFSTKGLQEVTTQISLQDVPDIQADIRLFLDCSFEEIRQAHPTLPSAWPSREQVSLLALRSAKQFIYPSIAIRFIRAPREDPVQRLSRILELRPQADNEDHPFAELDSLYALVLSSVSVRSRPVVKDMLGYLFYKQMLLSCSIFRDTPSQKGDWSPYVFAKMFLLSVDDTYNHLSDLHSVLDIPPPKHLYMPITCMHSTFAEYMTDQSRSANWLIDAKSVFVQQSYLLLKHINLYLHDTPKNTGSSLDPVTGVNEVITAYNGDELDRVVQICAGSAPRAVELMHGLWKLVEYEVGPYRRSLLKFNRHSKSAPVRFLTQKTSEQILRYLQACNIKSIQPSWWQRTMVRRNLNAAISKLRGKEYITNGSRLYGLDSPSHRRYFNSSWNDISNFPYMLPNPSTTFTLALSSVMDFH